MSAGTRDLSRNIWSNRIKTEMASQRDYAEKWGFVNDPLLYGNGNPKKREDFADLGRWVPFNTLNPPSKLPWNNMSGVGVCHTDGLRKERKTDCSGSSSTYRPASASTKAEASASNTVRRGSAAKTSSISSRSVRGTANGSRRGPSKGSSAKGLALSGSRPASSVGSRPTTPTLSSYVAGTTPVSRRPGSSLSATAKGKKATSRPPSATPKAFEKRPGSVLSTTSARSETPLSVISMHSSTRSATPSDASRSSALSTPVPIQMDEQPMPENIILLKKDGNPILHTGGDEDEEEADEMLRSIISKSHAFYKQIPATLRQDPEELYGAPPTTNSAYGWFSNGMSPDQYLMLRMRVLPGDKQASCSIVDDEVRRAARNGLVNFRKL